ncbi:di-N-acetylchitobiase-like [Asterias amurensis]|uniref:di-N-acetylchitobiase-like n=1 Tax=Asterias amurensis TaxID=7602 RepID=UPI003AB85167
MEVFNFVFATFLMLFIGSSSDEVTRGGRREATTSTACPCSDPALCNVISTPPRKEVFAFWIGGSTWKHFDWTQLTTIVMFNRHDPKLMCFAHSKGVRVVSMGVLPAASLSSISARSNWIMDRVNDVIGEHLDGINIDIEYPLKQSEAHLLTDFMSELTKTFHLSIPNSQVTFDVAWSPNCVDDRCYDYKGIAESCDFVFIMAYSEQSQIYGPCIAMANAPYNKTIKGIRGYLDVGISPDKLVLGVSWGGLDYVCQNMSKDNVCSIMHVPFRGAPCSDVPSKGRSYAFMMSHLKISTSGRLYNATYASPYFNYKIHSKGQIRQAWYDDPDSLTLRYEYAKRTKLRGVGIWNADSLDYSQDPEAKKDTKAMWDAVKYFLKN